MSNQSRQRTERNSSLDQYRLYSLPERHQINHELHHSINMLTERVNREPDSELYKILQSLKRMLAVIEGDEMIVREEEIRLTYAMLPELADSVRVWFLHYREKENSL